jgi:hypothetical protein
MFKRIEKIEEIILHVAVNKIGNFLLFYNRFRKRNLAEISSSLGRKLRPNELIAFLSQFVKMQTTLALPR